MLQMNVAAVLLLLLAAARCCDSAPANHQEHDEAAEEKEHEELDEEVHHMHGMNKCRGGCPPDVDCEMSVSLPEVCCPVCMKHKEESSSSESLSSETDECASIRCLPPDCSSPVRPPGNCCYVCV